MCKFSQLPKLILRNQCQHVCAKIGLIYGTWCLKGTFQLGYWDRTKTLQGLLSFIPVTKPRVFDGKINQRGIFTNLATNKIVYEQCCAIERLFTWVFMETYQSIFHLRYDMQFFLYKFCFLCRLVTFSFLAARLLGRLDAISNSQRR